MPQPSLHDGRSRVTFPDTPHWVQTKHYPTKRQAEVWLKYIITESGTDEQGWWLGWCPLHDKERTPATATARYHFPLGSYRCLADSPCHAPKKAMSLQNLLEQMALAANGPHGS